MRFEKIAATQYEFPQFFYRIAQILICDLLQFLGIASTQDDFVPFVLFDKIAQNRSSFLLLFVQIELNCRKINMNRRDYSK